MHGLALLASLLLSVWMIFRTETINNDGMLYISVAERILHGDVQGALALHSWPLFSLLLAGFHAATGLPWELAAQVMNTLFLLALPWTFVRVVRELGGDRPVQIAALILLLGHPAINGYRAMVIRDHAFWLLFLTSFWLFLRFARRPALVRAVAWEAVVLLAALFRREGLLLLLLQPLLLLLDGRLSWPRRLLWQVGAHPLLWAGLAGVLLLPAEAPGKAWVLVHMAELPFDIAAMFNTLPAALKEKADMLTQHVIGPYSESFAEEGLVVLWCVIYLGTLLGKVGLLHWALAIHGWKRALLPRWSGQGFALSGLAITWMLILAGFLAVNFFLVGRFVVPLVLLLLIPAAFSLAHLWERFRAGDEKMRKLAPVVGLLLVVFLVDGVDRKERDGFLREAGLWLAREAPQPARLFTNDPQIWFYSGRMIQPENQRPSWSWWRVQELLTHDGPWRHYQWMALRLPKNEPNALPSVIRVLGAPPVRQFTNDRRQTVVVFDLRHLPPASGEKP